MDDVAEMTERQRAAFQVLIGHIILERQQEALRKGEETVPIGDISFPLMERAFLAGWEWGREVGTQAVVEVVRRKLK